jgi:hypothetical protein
VRVCACVRLCVHVCAFVCVCSVRVCAWARPCRTAVACAGIHEGCRAAVHSGLALGVSPRVRGKPSRARKITKKKKRGQLLAAAAARGSRTVCPRPPLFWPKRGHALYRPRPRRRLRRSPGAAAVKYHPRHQNTPFFVTHSISKAAYML